MTCFWCNPRQPRRPERVGDTCAECSCVVEAIVDLLVYGRTVYARSGEAREREPYIHGVLR